ncbi:hypothetical protein BDZ94DRAFT_1266321 [Collybia nuda]|uniref:Uncharacterized protein n=1 Tax=Collybia nuda TaxID=64659 RepID=A0A9P5XYX3_9AGAR|nr:hypothetical protein BDZ94DRAFT_1266321 [Collybia nuda]
MTPAPMGTGMYIRFDPNKIVLPPIFGGPLPPHQLRASQESLKRKRPWEDQGSSSGFHKFEEAYKEATENEEALVAKRTGISSSRNHVKKPRVARGNSEALKTTSLLSFADKNELIEALRECFKQSPDVDFAGSYRVHDPGVSHKQRIQTMTHEIWKATGYRFTIKDHPRTKIGHKTRLWCSQDVSHRSKSSKAAAKPRTSTEGVALAKTRYPCRSGLLIASRDEGEPGFFLVTVRMHHHVAHEPYYDATLPPEMTQSIWETLGWRKHSPSPNVDAGEGASSDSESDEDEDPSSEEERVDLLQPLEGSTDPDLELQYPAAPPLEPEVYQQRMRRHIAMIRDFCDGLEYQLPFNDYRMLEVLESEGAQFLRLVEDCLKKEGRLKEAAEVPLDAGYEESHTTVENIELEGVLSPGADKEPEVDKETSVYPPSEDVARGGKQRGGNAKAYPLQETDDSLERIQKVSSMSKDLSISSSPGPRS